MRIVRLLLISVLCWLVFTAGTRHGKRAQFVKDQAELLDAVHDQWMDDQGECQKAGDASYEIALRKSH